MGLRDESGGGQFSNLAGIDKGLLFLFRVVVGDRNDSLLIRDVIDSDDMSEFSEEGGGDLFREELSILVLEIDAVDKLSLLVGSNSGADPFFLVGEMLVIWGNSEESVEIGDSILEVALLLGLSLFSHGSISISVADHIYGLSLGSFIDEDIDTSLFGDGDN